MPSGAKKRKAAKKKKEIEANSNSLHGDDDHKVHEEKESDGGETSSIQSALTESESLERVNGNGEIHEKTSIEQKSSVQIDRETKLGDDFEPKAITIEHVEIEDVYSNSSSSSDDESKFVDKNIEVINWEEPIEYAPNLEKTPEVTQVSEIVSHDLAQVSSNEKSHKDLVIEASKVEVPNLVSETITQGNENVTHDLAPVSSIEKSHKDRVIEESKVEVPNLVSETITQANENVTHDLAPVSSIEKSHKDIVIEESKVEVPNLVSETITQANENVSHDLALVSPYEKSHKDLVIEKSKVEVSDLVSETTTQVEPSSLSKYENLGSNVEEKSEILEVPSSVVDTGSQSNVDIVSTKATEDGEVTKIPFVGEDKSETLPQSSTPAVYKVNGAEHKKEAEIERMDTQAREALPPRPVQVTSSMGCCGLFELFMGSKR